MKSEFISQRYLKNWTFWSIPLILMAYLVPFYYGMSIWLCFSNALLFVGLLGGSLYRLRHNWILNLNDFQFEFPSENALGTESSVYLYARLRSAAHKNDTAGWVYSYAERLTSSRLSFEELLSILWGGYCILNIKVEPYSYIASILKISDFSSKAEALLVLECLVAFFETREQAN